MSLYPKFKTKEDVWNKFNVDAYRKEEKAPIKSTIKPKKSVLRLTQKKRLAALKEIILACQPLLRDYDAKEISNKSGLSLSTVYKLLSSRKGLSGLSLAIRFGTVQAFAAAAGLEILWKGSEFDLRIVE
jgi:hypothetical protein